MNGLTNYNQPTRILPRWIRFLMAGSIMSLMLSGCPAETPVAAVEPAQEPPVAEVPVATVQPMPATGNAGSETAGEQPTPSPFLGAPLPMPEGAATPASPEDQAAREAPPNNATAYWGRSKKKLDTDSPWRSVGRDGIHDRAAEGLEMLQQPRSALRKFPRARSGNFVDWVAALDQGMIRPRARVRSQGGMEVLDLNVVLADTKSMPSVTFPHRPHTELLVCGNCHEWLFKSQAGANDIKMKDILRGRSCGMCHNKVAFPTSECFRCHNGPRDGRTPVTAKTNSPADQILKEGQSVVIQ